jgi:hypothetical protein
MRLDLISCQAVMKQAFLFTLFLVVLLLNIFPQDAKPSVKIVGPDSLLYNEDIKFTASVKNVSGKVEYAWSVSEEVNLIGNGTSSVEVSLKEKQRQPRQITITVVVTWDNARDSISDSRELTVPGIGECHYCRPIDEFGETTNGDIRAKLDNLSVEINQDPNRTGIIFFNRSEKLPGKAARRVREMIDYWSRFRKFDASRIQAIDGGILAESKYRTYAVPIGESLELFQIEGSSLSSLFTKKFNFDSYSIQDYLFGLEYPQSNRKKKDLARLKDFRQAENHSIFLSEVADLLRKHKKLVLTILIRPEKGLTLNPLFFGQIEKDYIVKKLGVDANRVNLKIGRTSNSTTQFDLILEPFI